jgi:ABC-type uncharacterized transport system permease subunit
MHSLTFNIQDIFLGAYLMGAVAANTTQERVLALILILLTLLFKIAQAAEKVDEG